MRISIIALPEDAIGVSAYDAAGHKVQARGVDLPDISSLEGPLLVPIMEQIILLLKGESQ